MGRKRTKELVKLNCENCGNELIRVPTNKNRAFCSQSCYFEWLRDKRPSTEIHYKHTEGAMLAELQRVANLLGHVPTVREMRLNSQVAPDLYKTRFRTWRIACTCITNPAPTQNHWDVSDIDPVDGGWLAGIADGESTFRLAKHGTSFTLVWGLQLRADDIYVMEEIKRILDIKTPLRFWIRDHDRERGVDAGDAVRWYVRDIPTIQRKIIPFFTRFPLRSKKKDEFVIFTRAAVLLDAHRKDLSNRRYSDQLRDDLQQIMNDLSSMKKYKEPVELSDC